VRGGESATSSSDIAHRDAAILVILISDHLLVFSDQILENEIRNIILGDNMHFL